MLKKRILTIVILLFSVMLYGQKKELHDINFIISVNDKVEVGAITNPRIITYGSNDEKEIFEVDYYPGSLLLSDSIFDKLSSDKIKKMSFALDYNVFTKDKQHIYNYELEIAVGMFNYRYVILKIYDTVNGKRTSSKGKNYGYVVDIPGQSIVMDLEKD